MAVRERVSKEFELTGPVTFARADNDKNGQPYFILAGCGVWFFLPGVLQAEAKFLEEGQRVTIKGDYAGQTVRNGNRQAVHEVYEIIPLGEMPKTGVVYTNGVSKGQPA